MIFNSQQDLAIALGVSLVGALLLAVLGFFLFLRTAAALRRANDEVEQASVGQDRTERRLINVLNSIPVALVETDTTGRFVFANRAAHQLLGRKDAELIGLRFHSATWGITYPDGRLIPPELLPAARALRGQTVKGFQHLMVNPNTRKRMLVSVTAMPIMNAAGEVIGSTAAIVETEGLATPETARADEAIARRYFDMAGVMLLALDAEGRVRDINAAGAEVLGLPAADVVGQDWIARFVPEEDRQVARSFFRDVVEGRAEMPAEGESWILRGDGERRLMSWKGAVARDIQGGFVATLSTGRDITDERQTGDRSVQRVAELEAEVSRLETALSASETSRARTELALTQAQRLETAGRLSGGAAQDFDRLLQVVGGALETILAQADNPDRVRRLGQAALAANRRGEQLSRQLLALTQPRADDLAHFEVAEALRGYGPGMVREAAPANLRLEAPDRVGQVRVDLDQFETALRNLVDNARDAVANGGAITVGADAVSVGEGDANGLAPGDYVRVFVADTGAGMNAETAARATEVFFTTKPPARHAGLGLAQVTGFARHAGGAAVIDTAAGQGTTVSLYLPLAPAMAAPAPVAEPEPEPVAEAVPDPAPAAEATAIQTDAPADAAEGAEPPAEAQPEFAEPASEPAAADEAEAAAADEDMDPKPVAPDPAQFRLEPPPESEVAAPSEEDAGVSAPGADAEEPQLEFDPITAPDDQNPRKPSADASSSDA